MSISLTFFGIIGFTGFYMFLKTIRKFVLNKVTEEVELEKTLIKFSSKIKLCIFLGIAFYLIAIFSLFFH
jgi:hypothetical protein